MGILDEIRKKVGRKVRPTKKKSVEVQIENVEILDLWLDLKSQKTTVDADFLLVSGELRNQLEPIRIDLSTSEVVKTIEVNEKIRFGVANRYSVVNNREELEKVFGEDYRSLFREKMTMKLTKEALSDDSFLELIFSFLGETTFKKYFSLDLSIDVSPEYHEERHLNPTIRCKHQTAEVAGLVKCYAPKIEEV
jgi:hypothetical protein